MSECRTGDGDTNLDESEIRDFNRRKSDVLPKNPEDVKLIDVVNMIMKVNDRVTGLVSVLTEVRKEIKDGNAELKNHMDNEEAEKAAQTIAFNKLSEDIRELNEIKNAFVDINGKKDFHGHRNYHEGRIKDSKSWADVKQVVKNKVTENIVTFILVIFSLGVVTWLNKTTTHTTEISQDQIRQISQTIKKSLQEEVYNQLDNESPVVPSKKGR